MEIKLENIDGEGRHAIGFASGLLRAIEELFALLKKGGLEFQIAESGGAPVIKPASPQEHGTVWLDYPLPLITGGWMSGLNHLPNLVHWQVGDIVLHDKDDKTPAMLMLVTGFTKNGLVITRYLSEHPPKFSKNPMTVLHDPRRFGIEV